MLPIKLSLVRPTTLDITGVGIGSGHFITAKNQNPKTLITIDNMIQSPVVSTATTTGVGNTFTTVDDVLTLTEQPENSSVEILFKLMMKLLEFPSLVMVDLIMTYMYREQYWEQNLPIMLNLQKLLRLSVIITL